MKIKKFIALCLFANFLAVISAQTIPPLSPSLTALNPENIFPTNSDTQFEFKDNNKSSKSSLFTVHAVNKNNPIFTAEVLAPYPSHFDVSTTWKSVGAIKKDDVILARFAMRALYAKQESGEAFVSLFFQEIKGDRLVNIQLGTGQEWKVFDVPFVAKHDMKAGESEITLTFGQFAQKVEITGLQVLNFGQKTTLAQLPTTRFTYAGREANAPWRVAALKRIDKVRTAPLIIQVNDTKGKPLKGVSVTAKLVNPEFLFGSEVDVKMINSNTPDGEKYRKTVTECFNAVTIGNGLKWGGWRNIKGREETKKTVNWILSHGLKLRGHNLVWPGKQFTPSTFAKQTDYGPGFSDTITKHIEEIATYAKGKVYGWDVINEMMYEKDYFKVMPRTQAAEWFKQAKRIDPQATLFINEYSMLNGIASPKNIKSFLDLIAELQGYGAPIDAIGVQGHVGRQPRNPEQVLTDLDLFLPIGLPVQITEFDVNTPDDELQADYTRDFLIACYSHPAVDGFTMWGFWESAHWKPDAALFRKDWTAKPNAAVWRDLVTKQWRTIITTQSNEKGIVTSRGHLGLYEITVTKGKKQVKSTYQLTKTSNYVIIKL